MRTLSFVLTALVALSPLALAADKDPFLGTFQVTGTSPGVEGKYEGNLTITKQGSVYNLS